GGVETGKIHDVDGMTSPGAVFALNGLFTDWMPPHARPCPFAGWITVQSSSVPAGTTYRVRVRKLGQPWQNVVDDFYVVDWLGSGTWVTPGPGGWTVALPWSGNTNGMLARWKSAGDDLVEVGLEILGSGIVDTHRLQLDNTLPEPGMLALSIGPGDCGKYTVGTTLTGTFVARDAHFARYVLGTSPFAPPPGALTPSSGTVQTPVSGASWSLDTTGMEPCGYVIRLTLYDLAVVHSASTGRHVSTAQGFCLEAPEG
ncbi:MAG TPA: hypothetical protein VE173_00570, partial [Longimicrobiales bacterium]|nr:hypothetical protein [Longimicrobiales bacterium]